MNGKQIFALCVGLGGACLATACISTGAPVAFGTAEFSGPAAGAGVGLGGIGGIVGVIYSVFTLIKSNLGGVVKDLGGNDQIIQGGLSILQSLTSGKTDAIGLTKHAAVAVLFADRANERDSQGMTMVTDLSARIFAPKVATQATSA